MRGAWGEGVYADDKSTGDGAARVLVYSSMHVWVVTTPCQMIYLAIVLDPPGRSRLRV